MAGLFCVVWMAGIEARLVFLQVVSHDDLTARAESQQRRSIEIHPKRGEILDRNGRMLAISVDGDAIYAVPDDIEDVPATVAQLCAVMECAANRRADLEARLGGGGQFEYVQRQVLPAVAQRVSELAVAGIGFLSENRRWYPNGSLAAHALGYVGLDNQGLAGIESTYDSAIRGRPGRILVQLDSRRRVFSRLERPPTTGATVELTIDTYLQHVAERELERGVREHDADAGTITVLDPYSGDILAMASWPTFNPNVLAHFDAAARRNRAVQDIYEPGSTFKLVTASAALGEQLFTRDRMLDVSAGSLRIGPRLVLDMAPIQRPLSFDEVIIRSSNVGAVQIGLSIGPERLLQYVRRFGFGEATARDLAGQARGLVPTIEMLTESDARSVAAITSMSMGYAVGVTPLQMTTAVGAIANGGELVEPRLVRAVIQNGVRSQIPRRTIRRAIGAATAADLTEIMEGVVRRGTARRAQVAGYRVAGKTGTAEKLIDGVYSDRDHYASFVGFVPVQAPEFTVLVMIDTPRGANFTGGAVAAPIFRRFAEAALRYRAVSPTRAATPPVLRKTAASVAPAVQSAIVRDDGLMPDLQGMSLRRATRIVTALGMTARLNGAGAVLKHDPPPGRAIERGETVTLHLGLRAREATEDAS